MTLTHLSVCPCCAVCTQLLVSAIPSEDSVAQFVALLDRCIGHEAFTQRQRRRIASWKEQAHRIWNALPSSGRPTPSGPGGGSGNSHHNHNHHNHPQHHNGAAKNGNGTAEPSAANNSRSFARRWSNVAHYPGFYESSSMANGGAGAGAGASSSFGTGSHVQPNAYSLFPPGRQQQQRGGSCHPSPCPSPSHARPSYTGPTHNSYGQHTHLATSGPSFFIFYYFFCLSNFDQRNEIKRNFFFFRNSEQKVSEKKIILVFLFIYFFCVC